MGQLLGRRIGGTSRSLQASRLTQEREEGRVHQSHLQSQLNIPNPLQADLLELSHGKLAFFLSEAWTPMSSPYFHKRMLIGPVWQESQVREELHFLLVTTDVLILDVNSHSQSGGKNHRARGDREQKRMEEEKHLNLNLKKG